MVYITAEAVYDALMTTDPEFEAQFKQLRKECDDAESDVIADYGEDTADAGGAYEVWKNTILMSEADLDVKLEMSRCLGIQWMKGELR